MIHRTMFVRAAMPALLGTISALAVAGGVALPTEGCGATASQVQSATSTAIDLTNAVCSLAPSSPIGQPWVEVVCTIAQGVEQTVSVLVGELESEAGPAAATKVTMSVPVQSITLQIPAPNAPAFLAAHTAAAVAARRSGK